MNFFLYLFQLSSERKNEIRKTYLNFQSKSVNNASINLELYISDLFVCALNDLQFLPMFKNLRNVHALDGAASEMYKELSDLLIVYQAHRK